MPSFPEAVRFACERLSTMVARYPPGARYARHRDALQRGRRLTAVYYLNPAWVPEAQCWAGGGEAISG